MVAIIELIQKRKSKKENLVGIIVQCQKQNSLKMMYYWDNQEIQKQKSVKRKYGMGNKANPKIEEQNLRKGNMVEIIGQIHVRPSRHSNNGTRPQRELFT